MKALVITLPPDRWPIGWPHHWHIVDNHISRHVVAAVEIEYRGSTVTQYEWEGDPPICGECEGVLR